MTSKSKKRQLSSDNSDTEEEEHSTKFQKNGADDNEYSVSSNGDDDDQSKIKNIISIPNASTMNMKQYMEHFDSMANQLENDVILFINGIPHMFVEIEYYFKGYNHQDSFAHCDEMQLENCTWYFHRTGGSYRSGSFKGLDLTFGISEDKAYGGILIRSLQRIDTQPCLVDGPSLCVDHILKLTNQKDIHSFVTTNGRSVFQSENSMLYLKLRDDVVNSNSNSTKTTIIFPNKTKPIASGRVGLTLKRYKPKQEFLIGLNYRYIRLPDKVKKGKQYMTVSLLLQGKSLVDIKNTTKTTANAIEKIRTLISQGEKLTSKDLSQFKGDLSTDQLCQLLSLCNKLVKNRSESDQDKDDEEEGEEDKVNEDDENDDETGNQEEEDDE
eukprot:gene9302-11403_t